MDVNLRRLWLEATDAGWLGGQTVKWLDGWRAAQEVRGLFYKLHP